MKKKTLYIIIAAVLVVLLAILLFARGGKNKVPEGVDAEDTWAYTPAEEAVPAGDTGNPELWDTVIPDFTGKWVLENSGKATLEVYDQQDSTISFTIWVNEGSKSVAADIKEVGCIGTTGSFHYTDSNGGSGYGEIVFSGDDVYLNFEIENDPDGLNISEGAGRYVPADNG